MKKFAICIMLIVILLSGCKNDEMLESSSLKENQIEAKEIMIEDELEEEEADISLDGEAQRDESDIQVEAEEDELDISMDEELEEDGLSDLDENQSNGDEIGITKEDTQLEDENSFEIEKNSEELEEDEGLDYSDLEVYNIKRGIPLAKIEFYDSGKFIGGDISDGKSIESIKWGNWNDFERLVFEIGGEEDIMPHYEIVKPKDYGAFVVIWSGVRKNSSKLPNLERSKLIRSIDYIQLEDDSMMGFGISLNKNENVRVFELKNPNRLVIDIKK